MNNSYNLIENKFNGIYHKILFEGYEAITNHHVLFDKNHVQNYVKHYFNVKERLRGTTRDHGEEFNGIDAIRR